MSTTVKAPAVLKDPRFRAGSKLITSGRAGEGAIDIFALLLEEARAKFGESSIETSPVYYEYGNALFRAAQHVGEDEAAQGEGAAGEVKEEKQEGEEAEEDKKPAAVEVGDKNGDGNDDKKEGGEDDNGTENEEEEEGEKEGSEEEDDVELALSMMETSFAILEEYSQSNDKTYEAWVSQIHMPRTLLGIGDVLSSLERHADATDVYTRALNYRESNLKLYTGKEMSLEELADRRKAVEANILVAEEILACPVGEDIITTETKDCLVKAAERMEYVEGYYNKARDQLQDTVFLLGKLAAKMGDSEEFLEEKENVAYASVMVMAVGEQIAAVEEKKQQEESVEPTKKKARR